MYANMPKNELGLSGRRYIIELQNSIEMRRGEKETAVGMQYLRIKKDVAGMSIHGRKDHAWE